MQFLEQLGVPCELVVLIVVFDPRSPHRAPHPWGFLHDGVEWKGFRLMKLTLVGSWVEPGPQSVQTRIRSLELPAPSLITLQVREGRLGLGFISKACVYDEGAIKPLDFPVGD